MNINITQTNKNHSVSVDGTKNISITSYVYSLISSSVNITSTISINHYCDKTSFNSVLTEANILESTSSIKVFEIADITQLTDLSGIMPRAGEVEGTSINLTGIAKADNDPPKSHTLLYLNGGFKTNASKQYPNNV